MRSKNRRRMLACFGVGAQRVHYCLHQTGIRWQPLRRAGHGGTTIEDTVGFSSPGEWRPSVTYSSVPQIEATIGCDRGACAADDAATWQTTAPLEG